MVQEISEIEDNQHGKRPVLVTFQNSELQEGEEGKLYSGIYRKSQNTSVVAIATKNNVYTGEIRRKDEEDDLYNRFLLVSNRRTGKVRLIAVDTVLVTPQIVSKTKETTSIVNPNSSINELNKEFGSKKIKRITEQKERLKMNIEDVKEHLEKTVSEVEVDNTSFGFDNAENDSMYRPPINRDVESLDQVYNLEEIIPKFVLDSLEEEATTILNSDLDEFELSDIISEKLSELQNSSGSNVLEKAELLLYIQCLINYVKTQVKNLTRRFVICPCSAEVNSHILDNFSVISNTGRSRPFSMRDKTLCYILVLSMIAFDYQLDVEKISKVVKVGLKKLQEMGRILAFSSHGKDKNMMVLKLPLPPAVVVSPKKRKR